MKKTATKTRKTTSVKRSASRATSKTTSARKAAARPLAKKTRPAAKRGVFHHIKRAYHVTPKFVHGMVVGAFVGIMLVVPLGKSDNAGALTISAPKDCDSYAIVHCGVTSTNNIKNVYNNSGYVRTVFGHFKISSSDVSAIGARAVKGTVYANGDIRVNGKLVATGAVTAARKKVTSSDKSVTINGKTFFTRSIQSGWSYSSAPAYVVFNSDGIFEYAILASCGNPIVATPKRPNPELICSSLTYTLLNRDERYYEFKAAASAKYTTITSYVFHFGDGQKVTVKTSSGRASAKHRYQQSGQKYSAYVVVNSTRKSGVTSSACKVSLTTAQLPPILTCDGLEAAPVEGKANTYRFAATATATRTTITNYVFNFGDARSATVTTSANSAFVEQSFPADVTRVVTVKVNGKDFSNVTSPACQTSITTHTDECKPGVPIGSPECEETPTVRLTNVSELPNTGAGAMLVVLALSILGGAIFHKTHYHMKRRRHGHHRA